MDVVIKKNGPFTLQIIFQLDISHFERGDKPLRNPILLGASFETLFTSH